MRLKCLLPLITALFVLTCTMSQADENQFPAIWTPRTAVDFALRNNPDSLIANQRLLEAEALQSKAAATFYPQVDLSGGYGQTNNPMYSFGNILNQGAFSPMIDFNDPGRTDNLTLSAGITYRLYNGGQDQAHSEAATADLDLSTAAQRALLLRLEFEVYRSFQNIVEAQNIHLAQVEALAAIRSSLAVAQARFDAGDLLRIDLLNLELQESRALENRLQAAHALELAKKRFGNHLGLSTGDVTIDTTASEFPLRPAPTEGAERPELLQLQAAILAGEARLRAARGSRLPTVNGYASYQYDQGSVMDGSGDSWSAGVKVNFNIFNGYGTSADIAAGSARLAALRAEKRRLELALALETREAELVLSQAEQRLQVTEKMVQQATESEALSRARFNEGVLLASDLIRAETRLTDARVSHAAAISAERIAIAALRRSFGLSQFADHSTSPLALETSQ